MSKPLDLPDAVYAALQQAAEANGTTPADWIAAHLAAIPTSTEAGAAPEDEWIDRDFLKTYAHQADDSVSLESVRKAMAKIPGRLAEDIRAERDER
ncbi:MAG TPA: hypothetical protein VKE94_20615 [Gemmataceae bacterium]|nr:hypothetical protein [Gemmataceae bacterium]